MKTILIKICGDRIYFSPENFIPLHKTNLPAAHIVFKAHKTYYWELEMLSYDTVIYLLNVKIIQYHVFDNAKFDSQRPRKKIDLLMFESINWQEIEPLLSYYNKKAIMSEADSLVFTNLDAPMVDTPIVYKDEVLVGGKYSNELVRRNVKQIDFEDSFDVSFNWNESHFETGTVTFNYYYERLGKIIDICVFNSHLLSEFENIKYWIQKKIRKKSVNVNVEIKCKGGEIVFIKSTSADILMIDDRFLESIKYQLNSLITRPPRTAIIDKSLFTSEDIFDNWEDEDIKRNIFHQSDLDLMKFLMEKSSVRNKKQLMYLSGKLHSKDEKIRFTLHPQFGFLFLVLGNENLHFIWELLNSHATYVWSFDKKKSEIRQAYFKMEHIINSIRTLGRDVYRQSYKSSPLENGMFFNVINHQNAEGSVKDGFPEWKVKVDGILT